MKRFENFKQVAEDLYWCAGGGAITGAHWEKTEYIILGALIGAAIVIRHHIVLSRKSKAESSMKTHVK